MKSQQYDDHVLISQEDFRAKYLGGMGRAAYYNLIKHDPDFPLPVELPGSRLKYYTLGDIRAYLKTKAEVKRYQRTHVDPVKGGRKGRPNGRRRPKSGPVARGEK